MDADSIQALAAWAGAFSALFAGWTVFRSVSDRKNAHLLNHAKINLERAYHALCADSPQSSAPPHDRTAWLTSARLIEEYKATKARIRDKHTLQECESHEEHWRYVFYARLNLIQQGAPSYFSPRRPGEEIDKVSAIIIHAFAKWPKGKKDPLSKYKSVDDAYEKLGIHQLWSVLRHYCNKL